MQVSNIILFEGDCPVLYDFKDHPDVYLGPIIIDESSLPSDQLQNALDGQNLVGKTIKVATANLILSGVLLGDRYEPVIEGLDLMDTSGRTLQMRRAGAAYPYALTLTVVGETASERPLGAHVASVGSA